MSSVLVRNRDATPGVACACGTAQRVLWDPALPEISVHFVACERDSATHYHTQRSEIYVVIEGTGHLEADGECHALRAGTVVYLPPGVRHRPVPGAGGLTLVNVVRPAFDPEDEHHD